MSTPQSGHSSYGSLDLLRDTMDVISTVGEENENANNKAVQVTSECFTGDPQMVGQGYANHSSHWPSENDNDDRELLHQTFNIVNENKEKRVDENKMFLMSLLPFLSEIPKHRKLAIRHKLQRVFIDEQDKYGRFSNSASSMNAKLMPPPPIPPPAYHRPGGHIVGPQPIVTCRRVISEMSNLAPENPNLYYQNKNYETIAPPNVTITSHLTRPNVSSSAPPDVSANIAPSAVANVDYLAPSTSYYSENYVDNHITAESQNGNTMMTSYSDA